MGNENFQTSIQAAIAAHGQWKLRLKQAIAIGKIDANPEDVAVDNKCEFGKWLHGPGLTPEIKETKPYQVVKRLHAEFHICASQILKHTEAGETEAARALMQGEYTERSQKLMLVLTKWKMEMS
ncbi:MAG: CZB domain-containing protein [Rhodobacterales bacterium]|nr:CZB domain-containing protein [Rhodobacterales bacterium]